MEEKYKIPNSLKDFKTGTRYIVKLLDNTWSDKVIHTLCWSVKTDLTILMEENRIKIIQDE